MHAIYFRRVWLRIERQYQKELNSLLPAENGKRSRSELKKFYRTLHDELKSKHPQAKVLLPKMSAEVALCDNLAAAIFLLGVIYVALAIASASKLSFVTIFFGAIAFVYCLVAGAYRYSSVLRRHLSFKQLTE